MANNDNNLVKAGGSDTANGAERPKKSNASYEGKKKALASKALDKVKKGSREEAEHHFKPTYKLPVKHESSEKDEARLKMSKTTKRGETSFGGKNHF